MKKLIISLIILSSLSGLTFAADRDLPGISIITRQQRGADEAMRFSTLPYAKRKERLKSQTEEKLNRLEKTDLDEFFDQQKKSYIYDMRMDYVKSNFADEQKVDYVEYKYQTNDLKRPQSYHYKKTKIIVHHTAGDTMSFTGKNDVITYLQDIYKFHTLTKGRGDLGYNFLIDPFGNVYEGRAGGDGVVGAHDSRNNTPSLGISLMGNFDKQEPSKEQIKSLVALMTALAKKYNIDPTEKTRYQKETADAPYIKSTQNYRIAGHRDAGVTSCPGTNLYKMLPEVRQLVSTNLSKGVLISYSSTISTMPTFADLQAGKGSAKALDLLKNRQTDYNNITQSFKKTYIQSHKISLATTKYQKISLQVTKDEAKNLMSGNIQVLLYELSTKFTKRDFACAGKCVITSDTQIFEATTGTVEMAEGGFLLTTSTGKILLPTLSLKSKINDLVTIKNYKRVSAAKIPWNTFRGSLFFTKEKIKNLKNNTFELQYIVINDLPFYDYLKGIVETNDTEKPEKIKVMNLISKSYALFYLNGKNHHPSIPEGVTYNAIDNPDMFQKYVGAGAEKTIKKVQGYLLKTKNQLVLYSGYVPVLPYFSCSAGFTRSAQDKRGRSDTPYLQSRIDLEKCTDFVGHGVGLSGKGAQYFATKGWTYKQILQYYYPGVQVVDL